MMPSRLLAALGLWALANTSAQAQELCDKSTARVDPEHLFAESDFSAVAAEQTLADLHGFIPDWVDRNSENGREISLRSGELGMAYINRINWLKGYFLRQKALEEQASGEVGPATAAFCEFLLNVVIVD